MNRLVNGLWLAVIASFIAGAWWSGVLPVIRQEGMSPVAEALEAQAGN